MTCSEQVRCRVLLIGPLPPPVGGDTRLFSFLTSDLAKVPGFHVEVVNTSRGLEPNSRIRNLLVVARTLGQLLLKGPRADVISFHASDRGMVTFGPLLFVIARVLRKRVICRLFGGSFHHDYETRPKLARFVIRHTVLASDKCLFQTKLLVTYFESLASGRAEWFSNYTRIAQAAQTRAPQSSRKRCDRLVFLGHMWATKGIDVMLEVASRLPPRVTIDLYGPLDEYSEAELLERGQGRIRYRGLLTTEQVMSTLRDYDGLVLPTFHEGEGYPGVIVEAFSHGLPVIASRWLAIPEIVDDSCGILIAPKSADEFVSAVWRLHEDEALYQQLCRGALAKSVRFGDVYWTDRFVDWCLDRSPAQTSYERPLSADEALQ